MVIIDSEEFKSPRGPRTISTPTLSLPAYTPVDPHNSLGLPLPPPRSPGARPSSPFSAPASNYLTIKREKADITGSWNINTALPAPTLHRSFSLGSDDGDTTSDGGTEVSDPSTQATSVSSSSSPSTPSVPPNLKLLTPRGKIDAVIRVWGGPRAWIETVSRDEDVAVTFPPASGGAHRSPIKLFARSTTGNVQVHLPMSFMGTLRVPSDVVLPPSLRSQSVVLSPSEPPIARPPIPDESPVRAKLGLTSSSNSAGVTSSLGLASPAGPPLPPRSVSPAPPAAPVSPPAPGALSARLESLVTPVSMDPANIPLPASPPAISSSDPVEESALQVETPAQETLPPVSPPASTRSMSGGSITPTSQPKQLQHQRSASTPSILSHPNLPAATHESSESSTVYFIGDLLRSGYDTNAPEKWTGDEFVIDSEFGRVRVCLYGEKADVPWTEDVTRSVKDVMDWNKWKTAGSDAGRGLMEMIPMPKISVGGLGRRLKFGK
ncbi:hypothetical protein RhiXN_09571 [Rhizoctonia solani]|uniref:DUF7330 domain-containing protein n=1 Tax=Rhizoctonia solani TaxID=456999 RepID=A0A8H8SXY0_9AGAM|nr:uncharacterized protein RhiXN_09571 [Rhizoctonia solani]QRW21984.1 hypothetical protein RhiXN_09571 [Rhizoctonia solani]